MGWIREVVMHWFDPEEGPVDHLIARWLFLRALGLIYFSAFFALLYQVRGLIGVQGILPAGEFLHAVERIGSLRFWYAPTLLWLSPQSDRWLLAVCWVGLVASLLVVANILPRVMLAVCFVCFLSFVAAAQDFSGYQSDGMLLEAGFMALFLAPPGALPGWGERHPGSRAAAFLLLWEWFRIYFESGVVKLESGDPTWRNLTAMYEYYQNGPLPTWVGWYLQHLPQGFHVATAAMTLAMELVLVWMAFLPRPWRIACFVTVTVWQVGVILTANYAFLNYLVLVLAVLLLDDAALVKIIPWRWRQGRGSPEPTLEEEVLLEQAETRTLGLGEAFGIAVRVVALTWILYAGTLPLVQMFWRAVPLPAGPVAALEPFRIANQYGLFAVMTPHRYEIEFQGSENGTDWVAYPFRYKPQAVNEKPRIYAPYQPRFDWNLWFASLGSWREYPFVPRTEERLLENDAAVLSLFAGNPFPKAPPRLVRAVLWQYWFSSLEERRTQGVWWKRRLLGAYGPRLTRLPDGSFAMVEEVGTPGEASGR